MFLISLDELEYVKRAHHLKGPDDLARATGVSRNTWGTAVRTRKPTPSVLQALAALGARPSRVLVAEEEMPLAIAPGQPGEVAC